MKFKYYLENNVSYNYNINLFTSLPWNWKALHNDKIVNAFFYYAKENYLNGQPEQLSDYEISIITLPNLKTIPSNELSTKNIHTSNMINYNIFYQMLKNPATWYDDKIDQIYNGIQTLNKTPEYYNGKDIRNVNTKSI